MRGAVVAFAMKTRRTIKSDEYRGRRIFLVGWLTDLRGTRQMTIIWAASRAAQSVS